MPLFKVTMTQSVSILIEADSEEDADEIAFDASFDAEIGRRIDDAADGETEIELFEEDDASYYYVVRQVDGQLTIE